MDTGLMVLVLIVFLALAGFMTWFMLTPRGVEEVTPEEAARMVHSGIPMIDVRQPVEYRLGHAPGAQLVPLTTLRRNTLKDLSPGRPVVIICASGHRSALAATRLKAWGYNRVVSVRGGMPAWKSAGLPME